MDFMAKSNLRQERVLFLSEQMRHPSANFQAGACLWSFLFLSLFINIIIILAFLFFFLLLVCDTAW